MRLGRAGGLAALVLLGGCLEAPELTHAPADAWFSVGVVNSGGSIPQSSSSVKIAFLSGKPGASTVAARRVASPPTVDGDASDWAGLPESEIPLVSPGAIMGMTEAQWTEEYTGYFVSRGVCVAGEPCTRVPRYDYGIDRIRVRVAYDDRHVWFLFRWSDPTESRAWRPWVWSAGAWAQDATLDEDKLFLSFDAANFKPHDAVGCAAGCHVKENLGVFTDPVRSQRFSMHTNGAGQLVDGWTWRAARTGPLGLADDQFWNETRIYGDCPDPPACAQACLAGRTPPCSVSLTQTNSDGLTPASPKWMGEGGLASNPATLFVSGGAPLAVPIDTLTLPAEGTRIPAVALQPPGLHRDDVIAAARWADGTWTVELRRTLVTDDPNDAQFPPRP
ncbi:conserved hypothetical protein [Anaeromyxobacter sp. K]|uniref:ethylbenzene dehydrogenase-related protein n=1 Tax=Anaeromyxobacter sp. (strain K) TaxID=447217 RepID=UPI00017BE33B|nr:ethylbenzene dehydrogenase-related protein [Anaeromyxobacter sp. K]ACG72207.1 conserved hypothetical protein [Anaeromyxobacter sp. K]